MLIRGCVVSISPFSESPSVSFETIESLEAMNLETQKELQISDLTEDLIETAQKNDLEPEVMTDIEKELSKELVQQVIVEEDEKIRELATPVNTEIKSIFSSSPSLSDSQKVRQAFDVIEERYSDLEQQIKFKTEGQELSEGVVEYLSIPMDSLLLGMSFAEEISDNLGDLEQTVAQLSFVSLEGLGLVGIGCKCFILQSMCKLIDVKEKKKQTLIMQSQSSSSFDTTFINEKILQIDQEIADLKKEFREQASEVSTKFVNMVFDQATDVLDFVSSTRLVESHTRIIEKMAIASSGISLVGSVLSLGWNTYQVVKNAEGMKELKEMFVSLENEYKSLKADSPYVAHILLLKLDRLKKMQKDQQFELASSILDLSASSLALLLSVKGLIVSSVVLGVTAGAVLGGAGIFGTALLVGLGLTATSLTVGRAVYKKRHTIQYINKTKYLKTQKIIKEINLKFVQNVNEFAISKIEKISREINRTMDEIEELRAQQKKTIFGFFVVRDPQKLISEKEAMIDHLTKKILFNVDKSNQLVERETNLIRELKQINAKDEFFLREKKLKETESNFYNLEVFNLVKKIVEKDLTEKEGVQEEIKEFLKSKGLEKEENLKWDDVLDYVVNG